MDANRDRRLATPRLQLRPIESDALPAFHALCTEPSVRRFLFDDRRLSLDEARGILEASAENFAQRGWGLWLLYDPEADERATPAGFAGLMRSDGNVPDLVYAMRPSHQGAGHATEAARAVLDHAFGLPGVERVLASVDEPNLASIRVLEKLGMRLVRRDASAGNILRSYELDRSPS